MGAEESEEPMAATAAEEETKFIHHFTTAFKGKRWAYTHGVDADRFDCYILTL